MRRGSALSPIDGSVLVWFSPTLETLFQRGQAIMTSLDK